MIKAFYERHILPYFVHSACGMDAVMQERKKVVPRADGVVLEIGFGSGLNLGYYDPAVVERIFALEPSEGMWKRAVSAAAEAPFPVERLGARAEEIPLDDRSVDTVVITFTLCTVEDPHRSLREVWRVLRPGGQLLFCEHGASPDRAVRRLQEWIEPVWTPLAGGCHLTRHPDRLIEEAGFDLIEMEAGYGEGPRIDGFIYTGRALPHREE